MNGPNATLAALFSDVSTKGLALLRAELAVFRAEIAAQRDLILQSVLWVMLGAGVGLCALGVLVCAALLALVNLGLSALMAAAILGFFLALATILIVLYALSLFRRLNLLPVRTAAGLGQDVEILLGRKPNASR